MLAAQLEVSTHQKWVLTMLSRTAMPIGDIIRQQLATALTVRTANVSIFSYKTSQFWSSLLTGCIISLNQKREAKKTLKSALKRNFCNYTKKHKRIRNVYIDMHTTSTNNYWHFFSPSSFVRDRQSAKSLNVFRSKLNNFLVNISSLSL